MLFISNKIYNALAKGVLSLVVISFLATSSFAQQDSLKEATIVNQFYSAYQKPLYWFSSVKNRNKAADWLTMIGSADNLGLAPDKDQADQIRIALLTNTRLDDISKLQRDRQITGIVLNFIKNLQQGVVHFDYDEVSIPRDSVYIQQLLNSKPRESVSKIVSHLDCKDHDYQVLKKFLADSLTKKDTLKYKSIILAMNYRRYLTINNQPERIVVNIPEAELKYYRNNFLKEKMRTVVGRKTTPTPVIASYISDIVTFPPWNVPHSIAVKELLPKVQKNSNYLEQNNFEVVDAKGNEVDESDLKWKNFTEKNFPYFFRQSTGADNSLGVLKFNMNNPFSIYLHDTSLHSSFAKDFRFLSHGCVRLENPVQLANLLLGGNIDSKALKKGAKNTVSKSNKLTRKIPVFIIYMPVVVSGKVVTFLPDVYGLIK